MGLRDVVTSVYLDLQRIRLKLDTLEDCVDEYEMIFVAQELSADINKIEQELDEQFELGMDEE